MSRYGALLRRLRRFATATLAGGAVVAGLAPQWGGADGSGVPRTWAERPPLATLPR